MFNLAKKTVLLNGAVCFPLKTGKRATVFHDGGTLRTSEVVEIKQVALDCIIFETQNTNYCVVLQTDPAPAAHESGAADMMRSNMAMRPQVEFTHLRRLTYFG